MQRLTELRLAAGLSQKKLAEFLGVTNQTYSNYETGKREPSNDTILRLADYFNVSTDYLLGRTDDPEIKKDPAEVGEGDVKIALFGGDGEVTDEMWQEVLDAVEFIKFKRGEKKDGES